MKLNGCQHLESGFIGLGAVVGGGEKCSAVRDDICVAATKLCLPGRGVTINCATPAARSHSSADAAHSSRPPVVNSII